MKHRYTLITLAILLFGCQKEDDPFLPGTVKPGESPDGNRLSRIVFLTAAADSAYTDFVYDDAGRWVGSQTSNQTPVLNAYLRTRAVRNPAGNVIRYTTYQPSSTGGADSAVYRVAFDIGSRQYRSKVRVSNTDGRALDSTVYDYDGAGRITAARLFMQAAIGLPYRELAKAEFSYTDAGDLTSLRSFAVDPQQGPEMNLTRTAEFGYDDKINPLPLGIEAIVMDQVFFVSQHNMTRIATQDPRNGSSEELLFAYNYHPSNKPRSGQLNGSSVPIPVFFRYR